jgi:hypothetical protein
MKIARVFFIAAAVFFHHLTTKAYVGAISSATGRSGTAAIEASEAPYSNSSVLPFLNGYFFSAGWGQSHQDQIGITQDFAVSLIDNMRETVIPTSLAYTQHTYDNDASLEDQQQQVILGLGSLATRKLSFGLAGVYQTDRLQKETLHEINLQIASLYALTKNWGLTAIANNVIPSGNKTPDPYRTEQSLTVGTCYEYKDVIRAKFDVTSDSGYTWNHSLIGGGVENYLDKWLIFRIGYQRDNQTAANIYTAGVGFAGPKFSLNYAYQNSSEDQSLTRHSVDLAIPLW